MEDPPRSGRRSAATRKTRLPGAKRGRAQQARKAADPLGSRTKKASIHIKNAHNQRIMGFF